MTSDWRGYRLQVFILKTGAATSSKSFILKTGAATTSKSATIGAAAAFSYLNSLTLITLTQ